MAKQKKQRLKLPRVAAVAPKPALAVVHPRRVGDVWVLPTGAGDFRVAWDDEVREPPLPLGKFATVEAAEAFAYQAGRARHFNDPTDVVLGHPLVALAWVVARAKHMAHVLDAEHRGLLASRTLYAEDAVGCSAVLRAAGFASLAHTQMVTGADMAYAVRGALTVRVTVSDGRWTARATVEGRPSGPERTRYNPMWAIYATCAELLSAAIDGTPINSRPDAATLPTQ